ncbi:protein-lysine N-methyltransferase EFM3 isoform X1 [Magnolia sinica]|uniref:protein-lysine N-methyltransferase EFM3 isoform X1 n=1 Tax=Magnolia sinica TaxID=86752 RepID=UPI00265A17C6|nr:protein-lysine N-methyltransferase EFM3 isoform X1 [Magnolia sinica]XP_058111732.1 protein-lysine N-methyltransferase EFM3 isoform X1 [Magnolia sinica]
MDTALFSPSSLFNDDDGDDRDREDGSEPETKDDALQQNYIERTHAFPGMELLVREFSFHQLNANLLWPGTFSFGEWLVQNKHWLQARPQILELGSGTGALAIFLRKSFGVDITTSDFDDKEVEENIAHNCRINQLPVLPHIRHSWGDAFPTTDPDWDLVIANDILLYVKQYPNLIKTLSFLLKAYKPKDAKLDVENSADKETVRDVGLKHPTFLMSWRRRIGKEDEALFFTGCEDAGLTVEHLGSRVYCIRPDKACNVE